MSTPMRRTRFGLLRARRERPCGRHAADERNELAPIQPIGLHLLPWPGSPDAAYRIGEDRSSGLAAVRDFGPANDRSGHELPSNRIDRMSACPPLAAARAEL